MSTPNEPIRESEFVFRRLGESFPQFAEDLWHSVPLWLLILVLLVVAARIGYGRHYRKVHGPGKPDATLYWLGWGAIAAVGLLVTWVLVAFYKSDTNATQSGASGTLSALTQSNAKMWYAFTIGLFVVATVFVVLMYIKDHRSVRWYWAVMLAALRITVYAVLCFVFLLPAEQTWERTEKRSRVVVLIDVTPSMTRISDDITKKGGKPKKRIEYLLDTLQDKQIALVQNLLKSNPVAVYAFGTRLDDAPRLIERDAQPWSRDEWNAFVSYDFRPYLLRDLSQPGQEALKNTVTQDRTWDQGPKPTVGDQAEPANWAEWAATWVAKKEDAKLVEGLSEDDTKKLRDNIVKLERRIDVARSIALGTNVADSITAAVNRESPNMVQGVIVFSDMRSNLGSEAAIREVRERANKEKIPVFTIAVGEDRQSTSIVISDIQADDVASPEEGLKIEVGADGYGLAGKTVNVELDLFVPGTDPRSDAPAYTMKDVGREKPGSPTVPATITFAPGEPPHGQVSFKLNPVAFAADPDPRARALTVESKTGAFVKPMLKEGKWAVRARIAKDENEAFADAEHVRDRLGIQIIQKKLRVLVVAGAPSREFQFIRTFLAREVQDNRATVTLLVQNEAGLGGNLTPNPTEQIIRRFPTRLDLSNKIPEKKEDPKTPRDPKDVDERLYNFNEYDLIICFDPDWTDVSQQQAEDLKLWVERQGGGLIFVADRINTYQLARVERGDKDARLLPILEILPVIPDDPIAIAAKLPPPRTPRRLYMHPMPESDLLKLDDPAQPAKKEGNQPDDPIAGWERFFTDRDKYVENKDDKIELFPKRGFYSCYPLKEVKPGAQVLADFVDEDFNHVKTTRPWLVVSNPNAAFRTCFMGSGEIYRMYAHDKEYYERYWAKLMKYMAGKRNVKAARGRVLVSKEVISGNPIRVNAQILNTNSKPYEPGQINPKFNVQQIASNGEKKLMGPFELSPAGVDGYYKGQVTADTKDFPPGDFEYQVLVDVPDSTGEPLQGKFQVIRSDLEMDVTKPDFAAGVSLASDFDGAFQSRLTEELKKTFGDRLPKDGNVSKLAFRLSQGHLIKLIPECFKTDERRFDIRGPVTDLWDDGITITTLPPYNPEGSFKERNVPKAWGGKPLTISWVLLVVVGLLCIEWLTRKLLRLA